MKNTSPIKHTDINTKGWVSKLPRNFRPYALLMRLDRPIGSWLLFLPSAWAILLASGGYDELTLHGYYMLILFGFGSILMRGAGCAINDFWDRKLDAQVERTKMRPIASGKIKPKDALLFITLLLLIGLAILVQMPKVTIITGIISVFFIILYPLMKRWTWWPQAFLGLTINFGALMGWSAVTQDLLHLSPFLLYIAALFWTLGYDTIYAYQDIEDDELAGIKSSARALEQNAFYWIAAFYIIVIAALLSAGFLTGADWPFYAFTGLSCFHLLWQLKTWDQSSPEKSLAVFRSNRDFGIMIMLACIWS